MKIGVYICHCGINIAATVDVEKLTEHAESLPNVAISRNYQYMCSDPGQDLIKRDIEELGLDRIVVSACSPRIHEPTFREVMKESGLNPYCLEMVNIREQCSWVHEDKKRATKKAMGLLSASVARASLLEPLESKEVGVTKSALVIGGGIAGISTALGIADQGFKVYLVEKDSSIGGRMAQLDKTFPTLDCSACILTPKMVDVSRNPNIELMTYSEVTGVKGYVGNFKVTVTKKPRYIDEEICTGCGDCASACPYIRIPHEFNMGIELRGNPYVPFPQAVPLVYAIDREHCNTCGNCVAICEPGAIDLYQEPKDIELDVGAIVIATGYDMFDPSLKPEYGYSEYDNVITGLEFERLSSASGPTQGKILINGKEPKNIVLIQCVGSRDKEVGNEYCSRVCCMYTAKHAHLIREKVPDANISIFYMDVRAFGKAFEEFYDRVRDEKVQYIRGNASEVYKKGDKLVVRAEDTLLGKPMEMEADLVVLATAIVPKEDSKDIGNLLRISQSPDGFFSEAHPKLRPMDTVTDGIFLAGCCQGPKDIPDTVAQARGAASVACGVLAKDVLLTEASVASVDEILCRGCGECEETCEYGAPKVEEVRPGVFASRINEVLCKGCGACAVACCNGAITMRHFTDDQILAMIKAKMEVPV
ncbi:MAG: CoB--CoM heterodisulfide reductase iron-sulfur subunit A family protein [Halobacteriota archaeon]|nr:CoB--CoM heterodisulfide reductase iron-sulfur subunit A family protein [Halobacteriota archaeon]